MSDEHWLSDLIDATYAWAVDCGYRIGFELMGVGVAARSNAEHELDYYTQITC